MSENGNGNQYRGNIDVQIGDETYIFRIGHAEMAQLEKLFKVRGFNRVNEALLEPSSEEQIKMLRIALSRHHPDIADPKKTSDEKVAELIDQLSLDALAMEFNAALAFHAGGLEGVDRWRRKARAARGVEILELLQLEEKAGPLKDPKPQGQETSPSSNASGPPS